MPTVPTVVFFFFVRRSPVVPEKKKETAAKLYVTAEERDLQNQTLILASAQMR